MKLFFTLDYELFLGDDTGTPDNCLVLPMEELCKVAEKHHFKFIVFVDAAYLLRMKQLLGNYKEVDRQFELVCRHILSLSERGHDIQLHFHPQWLYSSFDVTQNKWRLERKPYKISDMPENDIIPLFHQSKELLDSIIGHKTIAFRAGGYCLTSFSGFDFLFQNEGIKIDSSVARGLFESTAIHAYDYRNIPQKQIYSFETDVCKEVIDGPYKELSISSAHWSALKYLLRVRPSMSSFHPLRVYGDGKSISDKSHGGAKMKLSIILNKLLKPYINLASIDGIRSCQLTQIYNEAIRKGQKELVLIGHPKATSDASINILDAFVGQCEKAVFCTTNDIL